MSVLIVVLVVIQISCLFIGLFQGFRYIKTEPLSKGGPWLFVAMALGPLLIVLFGGAT